MKEEKTEKMKTLKLNNIVRQYHNNGQHAEQVARYTLTGRLEKADNRKGNDCGEYQIKSARATVCRGSSLIDGLSQDPANYYMYVCKDFKTAYIFNRLEWLEFCKAFARPTVESHSNGNGLKWRLLKESKAMTEYLQARA